MGYSCRDEGNYNEIGVLTKMRMKLQFHKKMTWWKKIKKIPWKIRLLCSIINYWNKKTLPKNNQNQKPLNWLFIQIKGWFFLKIFARLDFPLKLLKFFILIRLKKNIQIWNWSVTIIQRDNQTFSLTNAH